ncbi:MAG: DUF427 domain-containing protein [Pseudomonadota bacterium]
MTSPITIRRLSGVHVVRAGGAVLGESRDVLEVSEPGHEPVLYFPRGDIAMAFLDASDKVSHCPHKGDASYYSIVTKSTVLQNAAWSYETPHDDVARIAGHLAFYTRDDVAVEEL